MTPREQRLRLTQLAMRPRTDGDVDVVARGSDAVPLIVPASIAGLLPRWVTFGTRGELRARAQESDAPHVEAWLDRLVEHQLLVPEHRIIDALQRSEAEAEPTAIRTLVVTTRATGSPGHRFAALERGLRAHLRAAEPSALEGQLAVFDDSRDREDAEQCRASVHGLAGDRVRYVGLEARVAFADAVADAAAPDGVPRDLVRFGLLGHPAFDCTAGSNRNAALLSYAEPFVSVDDDAIPRVCTIPDARAGVRLTSAPDPTEFWCFDSRADVLAAVAWRDADLRQLHAPLLGRSLVGCTRAYLESLDIDDMSPAYTRRVLKGDGRVAATYVGVAGDSGMASPIFALLQRGPSRQRMFGSPGGLTTALRSREVIRGVTRRSLVDSGFLMGLSIGLDARQLLPPFLPVGRNEDHTFGLLLSRAFDDALVGCIPAALLHAPLEPRAFADGDLRFGEDRLADLIRAFLHGVPPACGGDRGTGLAMIGRRLEDLAARPQLEFEDALRTCRARVARDTVAYLEALVRRHDGRPEQWAREVERFAATCEAARHDRGPVVAEELRGRVDVEVGRAMTREVFGSFGALLSAWPVITAAAAVVRERPCENPRFTS